MLILGVGLAGCTTGRYLGSVGRDGTYANRGYGFALRLNHARLSTRWKQLNPTNLLRTKAGWPRITEEPIDLNGDGMLDMGESVLHFDPVVRFHSRTSTGAVADLRVEILSGPARDASLDRLLRRALKIWTNLPADRVAHGLEHASPTTVAERDALVATSSTATSYHQMAVVDQGLVSSEATIRRRQLVTVHVYGPVTAADAIGQDFDAFLDALILNRAAAPESKSERW